jgi:hypothetical protein
MTLVALALPALAAILVVRAAWPSSQARWFQAFAAAAGGLALSSCAFFLWYPFLGHPKKSFVAVEVVVCVAASLAAGYRLMKRPSPVAPSVPPVAPSWTRWLWVPFAASAAVAVNYLVAYWNRDFYGHWDAVAIWNLRARFLFRTDANWPDTFSAINQHPDYPLFVPATIARVWCYSGGETSAGPIAVAVVMLVLAAGLLVSGLAHLRGRGQGWLAGAVLLAAFPFLQTAGFQYADVPLSVFALAAVAVLVIHDQSGSTSRVPPLFAGALAGFAAWTKNEGLLFFVALVLCRAVTLARRSRRELLREMLWFLVGALPAALALLTLKLGFAPPNDLVAGQGAGTAGRLTDGGRYAQIGVAVGEQLWEFGPALLLVLAGYALLVGRAPAERRVRGTSLAWAVLGVMAAGYGLVYLTTPHDLGWHLATSMTRLVVQVWPLFLFALFLTTDTADGDFR